ncbi:MAG TPA: hypothetical protein VK102_10395 [Sphingobacterium sp.]|nr:hypothetical protein [Sphingobacterium sp.]
MKTTWKWVIGILAFLIIAIVAASFYLKHNWKPIVEDHLYKLVESSTDGLYTLTYEDLDFQVFLGNAKVDEVRLVPDSNVYQRLVKEEKAPDNLYKVSLKELSIEGLKWREILKNKKLNIKGISLVHPDVELTNTYHAYNDTISDEPKESLYDKIKHLLSSIYIERIDTDKFNFKYVKVDSAETSETTVQNIDVHIQELLLDESSETDTSRLYFAKGLEVKITDFEYPISDSLYNLKFNSLGVSTHEKTLLVENFSMKPAVDRQEIFKRKNENVTIPDIEMDTIIFEELDFKKLTENTQLIAEALRIKGGKVDLYKDKRYPDNVESKIGESPHQKLRDLDLLVHIDNILLDSIDLSYNQMSERFFKTGRISFEQISGILSEVTNDSTKLLNNPIITADLQAKIYGRGFLKTKFGFDMLDKNGAYTYKGSLGSMQASAFNKILTPLLNIELASGNVKGLRFDMKGTDYRNTGTLNFDYDNLKVSVLNKNQKGKQKSKKVTSFLLNTILINESNPNKKGEYTVGRINYQRVPEYTFFKTLWKSLFEGIKQSAGVDSEREEKLIGMADKAKETAKNTKSTVEKVKSKVRGWFEKDKKE